MCPAARGARKGAEQVRKLMGLPLREKKDQNPNQGGKKRERNYLYL